MFARLLCLLVLLSASAAQAGGHVAEPNLPPGLTKTETEQLADGLYAFRWGAYRSIFLVADEGVIVTDPISPIAAERYRAEIAKITDAPVKYVVYSHAHWDHAPGAKIFQDEGAQIVAQQRCVQNIMESPHPDLPLPDITFEDTYDVTVGDQTLSLFYYGPSHGTCLIVMVARPAQMLYTVDIVSPPSGYYMPWDPQVADFHFYNAVEYLKQVEALVEREQLETLIGAHLVPRPIGKGKFAGMPSTGPTTAVRERREFWEHIMGEVKTEFDKGTPSFLIASRIEKTQFEKYRNYNQRDIKILLNRIAAYYAIGK